MKKKIKWLTFGIVIANISMGFAIAQVPSSKEMLQNLISGAALNESIITTMSVHLLWEIHYSPQGRDELQRMAESLKKNNKNSGFIYTPTQDRSVEIYFKVSGQNVYCETLDSTMWMDNKSSHYIETFNGEKYTKLREEAINNTVTGLIGKDNIIDENHNPLYWGSAREKLSDYLAGKAKQDIVRLINEPTIELSTEDTNSTVYIATTIPKAGGDYKLWINTSKGYKVERLEFYRENGLLAVQSWINLLEIAPGIWFPSSSTTYGYSQDSIGNRFLINTNITTVKEVEINVPIPSSTFNIEFPRGTKFYDMRTGASSKVGEGTIP